MKNLVLIGMPGCGKSTVGVVLAKSLGYRFLDSDLVIQEQEERLLSDIIEQEGVDGFLAVENRINAQLDCQKTVIATGGSVVYGTEAMAHLKSTGVIVYLQLPCQEICRRVGDLTKRGVAVKHGQSLQELYQERKPLYEQYADMTVDVYGMTIAETVATIRQMLQGYPHT